MDSEGERTDLESQALIWNHIFGAVNSFVLKCAINLQITDIIGQHGRPITLPELSASLPVPCTNLPILRRIMRYLTHMRIITIAQSDDGIIEESYALAPASKFLMKGDEKSLVPFAKLFLDEDYLSVMHALESCLDGDPAVPVFERVKGESVWAHSSRHPGHNELFNEAMACSARLVIPKVMEACREAFEGMGSLVDVGGGTGTVAKAIVREFPNIKCTVFDLPHVVEASPEYPGINYAGGDMFVSVPHADAIILMWILHDWPDEQCLRILKRCKEAISDEGGKLIIVDEVLGEDEEHEMNHARLAFDIVMMTNTGGKERTAKEWKDLLLGAGFSHWKITPIMALQYVIEARP